MTNYLSTLLTSLPPHRQDTVFAYIRGADEACACLKAGSHVVVAPSAPAPEPRKDQPQVSARLLTSDQRAKLHRHIVGNCWEPEMLVELVDRLVELVDVGEVSMKELNAILKTAKDKKAAFEQTSGAEGREMWKTLASFCKKRWERSGREWTKCGGDVEKQLVPVKRESVTARMERELDAGSDSGSGDEVASLEELRKRMAETQRNIRGAQGVRINV